jgi:hypothetical protein
MNKSEPGLVSRKGQGAKHARVHATKQKKKLKNEDQTSSDESTSLRGSLSTTCQSATPLGTWNAGLRTSASSESDFDSDLRTSVSSD